MNISLKVISILLSYPTQELIDDLDALRYAVKEEQSLVHAQRKLLNQLMDDIAQRDLYDLQERYVYLFDRTRTLSLHLFEHIHGESRDRGQAMVDLKETYATKGFDIDARELPDFLPLFLEFLSTQPVLEAHELLGQTSHILSALRQRLQKRSSVYATAFSVLEALADASPDKQLLDALMKEADDDPDDLEALDKVWDEAAVTFGGGVGDGCSTSCDLYEQPGSTGSIPVRVATTAQIKEI